MKSQGKGNHFTGRYANTGHPVCICEHCGEEFRMIKDYMICLCIECEKSKAMGSEENEH